MSPRLLAQLRAVDVGMRRLDRNVRAVYGDDASRYPRDFYRPLVALRRLRTITSGATITNA